jgi:hypothetical protein
VSDDFNIRAQAPAFDIKATVNVQLLRADIIAYKLSVRAHETMHDAPLKMTSR